MKEFVFNGIGIVGVFLILLAYFLLQLEKIKYKSFIYPFLNLSGAILILISLYNDWNLPAFIIQIAWVLISIYGLWKYFKKTSA